MGANILAVALYFIMKKITMAVLAIFLATMFFSACGKQPKMQEGSAPLVSDSADMVIPQTPTDIRVASLKGPTTMGIVKLMKDSETQTQANNYIFNMYGTADEIVPLLAKGEVDVAIVPANLASVLYQKTNGAVQVAAINNLGVLYIVENGNTITDLQSLEGKTIYSTGKGTTPEFVLNYILTQAGVNCTIEYKSEATEVAAIMETQENVIAMLPQPYVTAVQMQNDSVRVALDVTSEWDNITKESKLITGVLVVRKDFAQQNKQAFDAFLQDYKASCEYTTTNVSQTAVLVAEYGIVAKAPIAEKALTACNIKFIAGEDMKKAVHGYLEVLFAANPASIGGSLPQDDFYYGVS